MESASTTRSGKPFSFSSKMVSPVNKPITSDMDEMSLLLQANKQAENFHRFTQLAERIRPRLSCDGVNFNAWSRGLINAWQPYYNGDPNYFEQ
ncbi:hypothetical protein O181_029552 [Austropuccinia psidii MF-1]|uniref:Uncharacterized protein n=1 Tax=Austropuccinia psidii MF-1 TaxID=1389203 RepID=A0A9Q3H3M1_9BASI|nr:hypothetical protein [Austropuccinia psidii MF-1]